MMSTRTARDSGRAIVLSVFPGIGLLDRAFAEEGFCIVRGPDLLWGGDVRDFHPPRGSFDGVIGGPPCKAHSQASGGTSLAEDLIPEFARVVAESGARWFLMENVPGAPAPIVRGYTFTGTLVENRDCGGAQKRLRSFVFGWQYACAPPFEMAWWKDPVSAAYAPTVTANATTYVGRRAWNPRASASSRTRAFLAQAIALQGLPGDFALPGFTVAGAISAIANGVPMPMGRAVARAVRGLLETTQSGGG